MKLFEGVIVPMVSPLKEDHSIDTTSVGKIIESFVENNCAPFVLGTTGEAPSLTMSMKLELVKSAVKCVNGRIKTFAGISSTSLFESIQMGKDFVQLGADVLVATLPFYYPISPEEMLRFFEKLADDVEAPIVLYNMPAMVGESIPLDIAEKLSHHPNIVGMKDSERDVKRIDQSIQLWKDREDFAFYLGWAGQSAYSLLAGADGIVPSTANFVPELYKMLYDEAVLGNEQEAYKLQEETDKLSQIYQKGRKLNTSLPALKVLMAEFGLCEVYTMPPLYETVQDEQVSLKAQIRNMMESLSD